MKTILHIVKKMLMTLLITAIVIAISIAIMSVNQTAGIILMMLYSSFMVVKSSGKEMPLNTFTALLPGLMSLVVFLIMLGMIGVQDNELMPLIGIGLGIIPGWLMARGHKIYKKNGIVYAKRTFFYVFIWVLSLLFTQGSTLAGMRDITNFGFLLNGFSTAMMVVLSVMLIYKTHNNQKLNLSTISNVILVTFFLTLTVVPFLKLEAQEDTQIPSWVRNPPKPRNFQPAGLMSNSRRITDPDKLDRYRRTFQNRNRSRTADEKARAIQHSGFRTDRVSGSSPQSNYQHNSSTANETITCRRGDMACCEKVIGGPVVVYDCFTTGGTFRTVERVVPQIENHRDDYQHNSHIHSHINSNPAFSDDEITAGAVAALLMLLGSLSLNAAMLAAQEVSVSVSEGGDEEVENDGTSDTVSSLIDPYDGEALPEENGMYWDGYGERWMTRDEAEHFVSELNRDKSEEDSRREQELDAFEEQNERERVQRNADREQRLRDEGNVYDEEQDAWVKNPTIEESRNPVDEYYDRGDYIQSHLSELTSEQRESVQRILDRIGWNASAVNTDGSTNNEDTLIENQQTMERLSQSINNILTGRHQSEMAQEEHNEIDLEYGEKMSGNLADAGEMAASCLDPTKGAVAGFVFEGIQSADKGVKTALWNASVSAASNVIGDRLGNSRSGDVLWNALTSGLTSAAETGAKGGNAEDMTNSFLFSGVTGGGFEHINNIKNVNGRNLFDFDGPHSTTQIDEPDIASHSHTGANEDQMIGEIKQSVANNEAIQRAEAIADKLRRGESVTFENRNLAESRQNWHTSDRANVEVSSGHIRTMGEFLGIERTRYMEHAINSGKYPDLDRIDREIRAAWTEARFGGSTDSWNKFQTELEARNISSADYDKWEEVALSSPSKEAREAAMETVVRNRNLTSAGSDTVINHQQNNIFGSNEDTFIQGDHTDKTVVNSSRVTDNDMHQSDTLINDPNKTSKYINNNDTVISEEKGKINTEDPKNDKS